jgi:hypothetical protein
MATENYGECAALQALIQGIIHPAPTQRAPLCLHWQANAKILYADKNPEVITYNQGQGIYACVAVVDRSGSDPESSFPIPVRRIMLQYEPEEPSWGLKGSLEHLLRQTQKLLGKNPKFLNALEKSRTVIKEV